jgi:hypothetical protein
MLGDDNLRMGWAECSIEFSGTGVPKFDYIYAGSRTLRG